MYSLLAGLMSILYPRRMGREPFNPRNMNWVELPKPDYIGTRTEERKELKRNNHKKLMNRKKKRGF